MFATLKIFYREIRRSLPGAMLRQTEAVRQAGDVAGLGREIIAEAKRRFNEKDRRRIIGSPKARDNAVRQIVCEILARRLGPDLDRLSAERGWNKRRWQFMLGAWMREIVKTLPPV